MLSVLTCFNQVNLLNYKDMPLLGGTKDERYDFGQMCKNKV